MPIDYDLHNYFTENSPLLFFQKHIHWENEHELKVIELGKKEYCPIENSLAGIYLGVDFEERFNAILNFVLPKHVWVEKVYIEDGRFKSCDYLNHLNRKDPEN